VLYIVCIFNSTTIVDHIVNVMLFNREGLAS
jgi:hypothetical protein